MKRHCFVSIELSRRASEIFERGEEKGNYNGTEWKMLTLEKEQKELCVNPMDECQVAPYNCESLDHLWLEGYCRN